MSGTMKKLILTMLLASVSVSTAQGQSANQQPDVCVPVGKVLDLARINAPEVRVAAARIAEAEADVTAARSLYKPQISAFGRSGFGDTGITDSGVSNQIGLRAEA